MNVCADVLHKFSWYKSAATFLSRQGHFCAVFRINFQNKKFKQLTVNDFLKLFITIFQKKSSFAKEI